MKPQDQQPVPDRGLPPGARSLRLSAEPRYSLVLASTAPLELLERSLALLVPLCTAREVELVVARACPPEELAGLSTRHPSVLFMPAPDGSTLAQLRFFGLGAADGDIVLLADASDRVGPEWLNARLPQRAPSD